MKAAVVIDDWKLPIFERHLLKGGYRYDKGPGPTEDSLLIRLEVKESDLDKLKTTIEAANTEAANKKKYH